MGINKTMECRLCGSVAKHAYDSKLLRYTVSYFQCSECDYFQTEKPFWLDEAYSNAINDSDTGILVRNQDNARRVIMTLLSLGDLNGRVLDYAGGYGILVRLLRDLGVDAFWSDKHCSNLLAKGFEHQGGRYGLVTAFEVFEHFENPVVELNNLLEYSDNVLISTELFFQQNGPEEDWWYRAPEHGQHIGFFNTKSLEILAGVCKCHVVSLGTSVHLLSRNPVPVLWKVATRFSRFAPIVAKLKLQPKTIADFNAIRHENRL
ncbi:class I SAM-dependent methyltransferase [Limnobacter sp.]|uniref:class I SAM-dependent methyltransferase n=1 Tax=Limnobacter sp. TaxID=2003368 RepID=UPI0025BD875E|nr:class I SAM-dependent methyltransferase [Limnobacter sp.]